jgi:transitional endoplasmic reticulum ATPase
LRFKDLNQADHDSSLVIGIDQLRQSENIMDDSSMDDSLLSLREALRFSPDNLPLRQHIADTLLQYGKADEAETEYKAALGIAPDNNALKLGLARVYYQLGKDSDGVAIIEDILADGTSNSSILALYSRLLMRLGQTELAVEQFKLATFTDPELEGTDLATELGLNPIVSIPLGGSFRSELKRPGINFKDVGGMESIKEEIRLKIIYPLTQSNIYKAYGKKPGGGILMYGPPGTGKTHLARATAGEIRAGFITVGLNDILDMWLGNSERNLHEVFDQARRNTPCVVFFDEVDALAAKRNGVSPANERIINQFLMELDGIQHSNEGILFLAATNAPWHLDSAFRRPGRFDRMIFIPPPDESARCEILRLHCKGKPVADIDYSGIVHQAKGFSGADLAAVVDIAVESKLKEAMLTGIPQPLTTMDLVSAISHVKCSTTEWLSTARNYALHSNADGSYDHVINYLNS